MPTDMTKETAGMAEILIPACSIQVQIKIQIQIQIDNVEETQDRRGNTGQSKKLVKNIMRSSGNVVDRRGIPSPHCDCCQSGLFRTTQSVSHGRVCLYEREEHSSSTVHRPCRGWSRLIGN